MVLSKSQAEELSFATLACLVVFFYLVPSVLHLCCRCLAWRKAKIQVSQQVDEDLHKLLFQSQKEEDNEVAELLASLKHQHGQQGGGIELDDTEHSENDGGQQATERRRTRSTSRKVRA